MEKAVRRIGVFTSGGDAPGMNAAIRAVVRTSLHMGIECVGIRRGYHGLINGDFTKLTFESVSDLSRRGGTMLYSARSEEFKTPAGQERAVATCKMLGLDALVGIGGDGTFSGLLCLAKRGLSVVGIPGTIDNDIACSSYTIGYDTACNTALESIDKLRDTMQSHERCSVVEVMGRHAGYLALYVGVAVGATAVLVPEHQYDFEKHVAEKIRAARLGGKTNFMIVVAEGAASAVDVGRQIQEELDSLRAQVAELEEGLARKDRELEETEASLAEKESAIAQHRETIAQQAEALAELEAAGTAAQVDAQLRAAYQEGVEQNG